LNVARLHISLFTALHSEGLCSVIDCLHRPWSSVIRFHVLHNLRHYVWRYDLQPSLWLLPKTSASSCLTRKCQEIERKISCPYAINYLSSLYYHHLLQESAESAIGRVGPSHFQDHRPVTNISATTHGWLSNVIWTKMMNLGCRCLSRVKTAETFGTPLRTMILRTLFVQLFHALEGDAFFLPFIIIIIRHF
jgi:hypothetical protein